MIQVLYSIVRKDGQLGIQCEACGMTSYHPEDITQRFCGNCHRFLEERSTP
jgi:ribosomal protein L37E